MHGERGETTSPSPPTSLAPLASRASHLKPTARLAAHPAIAGGMGGIPANRALDVHHLHLEEGHKRDEGREAGRSIEADWRKGKGAQSTKCDGKRHEKRGRRSLCNAGEMEVGRGGGWYLPSCCVAWGIQTDDDPSLLQFNAYAVSTSQE